MPLCKTGRGMNERMLGLKLSGRQRHKRRTLQTMVDRLAAAFVQSLQSLIRFATHLRHIPLPSKYLRRSIIHLHNQSFDNL